MKKIACFYLESCPYCQMAVKAFKELQTENSAWKKIPVEWIDEESLTPAELKNFDYYYVPAIYVGEEKIYEASPADDYDKIKSEVKKALEFAA